MTLKSDQAGATKQIEEANSKVAELTSELDELKASNEKQMKELSEQHEKDITEMSRALEEAKAAVPETIEKKSSHKSIVKDDHEAQTELTAEILAQLETTVEDLRAQLKEAEERLANMPSKKSL